MRTLTRAMRRSLTCLLVGLLLWSTAGLGCQSRRRVTSSAEPPSAGGFPSPGVPFHDAPAFPTAGPGEPVVRVVDLVFDVVRIDFPVGEHRHSLKIWNHVDTLSIESETAQRLTRNGMRIGLAAPESWPAMVAIFQAGSAKVGRERLLAPRGMPVVIKLGAVEESESVFRYLAGGQLVGKTLTAGDKLLVLDYVFHPQLGGVTDLRVGFEVLHDRGELTWERRAGIIQQTPAFDRDTFDELQAIMTLRSRQFLVIGLAAGADHEYLVGSRLLSRTESGERFETMLCIAPKAFQTEGDRPLSLGD